MLGDITAALAEKRGRVSPMKSTARRRLQFGEVDHKGLNEFLDRGMDTVHEESKARWNYDFVEDCPLPGGRFHWAPVDLSSEYIPGPYLNTYKCKPKAPRRRPAAVPYTRTESVKRKITFDEAPRKGGFADENVSPLALAAIHTATDSAANATTTSSSSNTQTIHSSQQQHLRQTTITAHFVQQKKKLRKEKSCM